MATFRILFNYKREKKDVYDRCCSFLVIDYTVCFNNNVTRLLFMFIINFCENHCLYSKSMWKNRIFNHMRAHTKIIISDTKWSFFLLLLSLFDVQRVGNSWVTWVSKSEDPADKSNAINGKIFAVSCSASICLCYTGVLDDDDDVA